jgi:hypothetical protein
VDKAHIKHTAFITALFSPLKNNMAEAENIFTI